MSKCKDCGGNKRADGGCNICELLAVGETFALSVQGGTQTTGWPIVSNALAVHPKQVKAANARNKRHGVGVSYRPDGKAVIPDRGERKRLLRLEGMHDNDGGYGD